ncbi:hypothetical protein ABIE26_005180 [Pedobacter africanus]|uniref:Uncharacterized protein n=1 Tax=Pedobacter africanus TaxID=151894 RepID=A0ACC6L551_9SPHI|nr:hypothetical protein [Pedobacter africanus]MDR6786634.1 hypothetical protein [Pedobacter africanus]
MRNLIILLLAIAFLFQSCTSKDKHPDILTLEKLIENGEVIFIEKKDSVSLFPFITFLSDSVYLTQTPHHNYSETKTPGSNEKTATEVSIKNSFALKNVFNGKTYHSETLDSKSSVFINEKNDLIIKDIMFLAPDYNSKIKADTTAARNIADVKMDEKLKKLNEFDESIIYKWTNTGRLGTMHEMFYYQFGGKKFKSTSECYLITENGNYFYNGKLGILQIK